MIKLTHNHPMLLYANDIIEICSPLKEFDINYFSHVHLDNHKNFSVICNNPEFIKLYFEKKYYNSDIHTEQSNLLGSYVIWDDVPRGGTTLEMGSDAAAFNIKHTFTIIEKDTDGYHYYHFSSPCDNGYINQMYLSNLDILKYFINYFKKTIYQSTRLSAAYNIKFETDQNANGYTIIDPNFYELNKKKIDFISRISSHDNSNTMLTLSNRERECVHFMLRGKSAKKTATILGLSHRTVETYINNAKQKFLVNSKEALIEKWIYLCQTNGIIKI